MPELLPDFKSPALLSQNTWDEEAGNCEVGMKSPIAASIPDIVVLFSILPRV